MVERISKRFLSLTLVAVMLLSLLPAFALPAFAATSGTLNGLSDSNIGIPLRTAAATQAGQQAEIPSPAM